MAVEKKSKLSGAIDQLTVTPAERQKLKCLELAVQIKQENQTFEDVLQVAKEFFNWIDG